MKTLRFLLFLLTAGMLFMGCQKELSEENGRALGNLPKDVLGNCQSPVINGNYVAGVALSPTTESIALQINISQVGVYSIVSDTINGYYFSGTGVTGVTGINTVRLEARGTPTVVGTDVFNIKFDGTTCQINNIVTATPGGGGGGTAAVFTLGNTAGNCTSTPAGVYAENFPTSTTLNYVDIGVTVTTAGTYNVTSTIVNGVKFSGSGNVSLTSTTIRLYADGGTPTAQGNTAYLLTVGTSTCSFSINYLAPLPIANLNLNCGAATVTGTFQAGAPVIPTNKITISAIVTQSGAYNISTTTVNGVRFVGAGTLTASATAQNIDLFAIAVGTTGNYGTSVGAQTYNIQSPYVVGTGTSCTSGVVVTFTAPTGGGGGAATDSVSCFINGGPIKVFDFNQGIILDNTSLSPLATGYIMGGDFDINGDESIVFGIYNATGVFPTTAPLTYTVNQAPTTIVVADYDVNSVNYTAISNPPTVQSNPFTITITSISGAWGVAGTRVKGTFSGSTKDNSGAGPGVKLITGGYFDLTF
jgi:hypothetical protein